MSSVPIVSHYNFEPDKIQLQHIENVARQIINDEPAIGFTGIFGDKVQCGTGNPPRLILGNAGDIVLSDPDSNRIYEYRSSLLANEGDIIVVNGDRDIEFELYRQNWLGLGNIEVLNVECSKNCPDKSLAQRILAAPEVIEKILRKTRTGNGLTIVPHIGNGHIWNLAREIAQKTGANIYIESSPPRLTQRTNDKLWFASCARNLFGFTSTPMLHGVYGPSALANYVSRISKKYGRVVIKVPDSAGSAGNISVSSENLNGLPLTDIREKLVELLRNLGWKDKYPVLVQVWDSNVLSSPSAQVWIPKQEEGKPIIEGVFEQIVEGEEGEFIGAIPADLPDSCQQQLVSGAMKLAVLFQKLGYYGRCSFDTVIDGENFNTATLHWIECNARWGGVSIPMSLANRLNKDWTTHPFAIAQSKILKSRTTFKDVFDLLHPNLFHAGKTNEGLILLTPIKTGSNPRIHIMATAETLDQAKAYITKALRQIEKKYVVTDHRER